MASGGRDSARWGSGITSRCWGARRGASSTGRGGLVTLGLSSFRVLQRTWMACFGVTASDDSSRFSSLYGGRAESEMVLREEKPFDTPFVHSFPLRWQSCLRLRLTGAICLTCIALFPESCPVRQRNHLSQCVVLYPPCATSRIAVSVAHSILFVRVLHNQSSTWDSAAPFSHKASPLGMH